MALHIKDRQSHTNTQFFKVQSHDTIFSFDKNRIVGTQGRMSKIKLKHCFKIKDLFLSDENSIVRSVKEITILSKIEWKVLTVNITRVEGKSNHLTAPLQKKKSVLFTITANTILNEFYL